MLADEARNNLFYASVGDPLVQTTWRTQQALPALSDAGLNVGALWFGLPSVVSGNRIGVANTFAVASGTLDEQPLPLSSTRFRPLAGGARVGAGYVLVPGWVGVEESDSLGNPWQNPVAQARNIGVLGGAGH